MTTFADICGHSNRTINKVRRYHAHVADLPILNKQKKDTETRFRTLASEKWEPVLYSEKINDHIEDIDSDLDAEELEFYVEYLQKAGAKYDAKQWPLKRYVLVLVGHSIFWLLFLQLLHGPDAASVALGGLLVTFILHRLGILWPIMRLITAIIGANAVIQHKKNKTI